jgi:hypothetical protein
MNRAFQNYGLHWQHQYIPLRRVPRAFTIITWIIWFCGLTFSVILFQGSWRLNDQNAALIEQVAALKEEVNNREQQLLSCLNGKQVGWYATRTKQVYVVCRPAEEYDIPGI